MLVNFNKELRMNSGRKIHEGVIEHLNSKLPIGTHYNLEKDGTLRMVSDTGSLTLGGFELAEDTDLAEKLGPNPSKDKLFKYFYNSQKPIPLKLKKEGYMVVNGQEMKIEDIVRNPASNIVYETGYYMLIPSKFPPAKDLTVSANGYERVLKVQRVPNDSCDEIVCESDNNEPLKITLKYYENTQKLSFTCSTDLKYAKNIKDVVESIYIYNGFIDGVALIDDEPIPINPGKNQEKKFDSKVITFWNKTLKVENIIHEALGFSFYPQDEDVDLSTMYVIEELYQCLVKEKPVRKDDSIESISGDFKGKDKDDLKKLVGEKICFQYISQKKVELFGVSFNLNSVNVIFDDVVERYDLEDDRYTLYFSPGSSCGEQPQPYFVTKDFIAEDQMNKYLLDHTSSLLSEFKEAQNLKDLIEIY